MRKINYYLGTTAMFIVGLFAACSDNSSMNNEPDKPKDDQSKMYMNINISSAISSGTRSSTKPEGGSSDGIEPGQNHENEITNVMVLLVGKEKTGKDKCFIAKWTKSLDNLDISETKKVTAEFERSALLDHFEAHEGDETIDPRSIRVYVICNYTSGVNELVGNPGDGSKLERWLENGVIKTSDSQGNSYTKDNMPYWKAGHFLMTNAKSKDVPLPKKEDIEDRGKWNTPATALDITTADQPVEVERAVARFDYAATIDDVDASGKISKVQVNPNDPTDFYYVYNTDINNDESENFEIRLRRMSLVNMSKEFYLFRRVSDDGTPNGTNYAISGLEHSTNYVVDPNWEFKSNVSNDWNVAKFATKYHYPMLANTIGEAGETNGILENTAWDNYDIVDIITSDMNGRYPQYDGKYHFWRYVTPNTISDPELQKNGISTGIVFKAKIDPADPTKPIGKRMNKGYDIFALNGTLLGSWYDVATAAEDEHADAELKFAYNNAIAENPDLKLPENATEEWLKTLSTTQNSAAVKVGGFARYQYVNGYDPNHRGYYCYYYYWNRHNDNGDPNRMGIMEFGVVRNNVYKLHVTNITKLGHPFQPDNDPDPVDPEDPDEVSKLYMQVYVKVLPWTKRINYIDF